MADCVACRTACSEKMPADDMPGAVAISAAFRMAAAAARVGVSDAVGGGARHGRPAGGGGARRQGRAREGGGKRHCWWVEEEARGGLGLG